MVHVGVVRRAVGRGHHARPPSDAGKFQIPGPYYSDPGRFAFTMATSVRGPGPK
jgi:hypothetical protein